MDEVEFGRYRLIALIGQGAMGKVYRAHDTVMGRDVAVKVLPAELATEPGYEQRFRREASTAARLSEPHIIPIFEAGEIEGRLYLVMPVIDGIDVHTLLQRDGPMSPQRAVQVIEQLAAALNAAHAAGLVHRDIKPSNALLTGDDFAYLIDFGIAHDGAATRLTSTGMMVGTLAYMAPERFTAGTADARSDVYALACVLCECLTGATPYPGDSMEQQIAGHLTLDPPKPSEQRPDVPAGFDEVIATGMAKKPDERYQSARELATAARHALTEVSAPAGDPHTPVTLLDDPTRPAPAPAGEESVEPTQPAIQQRPPGWPRGDRNRWLGLGVAALVVVATLAGAGIYFGTKKSNKGAATTSTTTAPTTTIPAGPPPVAEGALDGLLLSPAEINTTMGGTEMTVYRPWNTLNDVGFKNPTSPPECNPLSGAAEDLAYAGSGWTAVRGQTLQEPQHFTHFVDQGVVFFPSAQAAAAFVSASTQSWPACANRSYTGNVYNARWSAGPVSTTNGTLSATSSMANGWACQRALTARNNVVIDVTGCSFNTTEQGVSLADQIAAKVPTT